MALPIGLPVTLALAAPIDTATAVRRRSDRRQSSQTGAPRRFDGGSDSGRRHRPWPHSPCGTPPAAHAVFSRRDAFNRVDVQGIVSPFVARSEADAALARELGANLAIRETGIWFWGVGTFLFPTSKSHTLIPGRFRSEVVHTGHRQPMTRMAMH